MCVLACILMLAMQQWFKRKNTIHLKQLIIKTVLTEWEYSGAAGWESGKNDCYKEEDLTTFSCLRHFPPRLLLYAPRWPWAACKIAPVPC